MTRQQGAKYRWSLGECATLATIIEVTAPKPGNVHRGADFEDLSYGDFLIAATAIGPVFERAGAQSVGETVLEAIKVTRAAVATNTNLGTVLLAAPLAAVPRDVPLAEGIGPVLAALDARDARLVYEAIRLAQPGGMGKVEAADVSGAPPQSLIAAMRLAADRDLVARQYANNFDEVRSGAAPWLREELATDAPLLSAVVRLHLRLLSRFPDSLVARKCGFEVAHRAAQFAQQVLDSGPADSEAYQAGLAELDFWLRSDGHRRNPGTTADLVAAALFVLLRDGELGRPLRLQ